MYEVEVTVKVEKMMVSAPIDTIFVEPVKMTQYYKRQELESSSYQWPTN